MDSNSYLKELKVQLEADERELSQVDVLIKTLKDAGESTADLENQQRKIKESITRWKNAISKNLK